MKLFLTILFSVFSTTLFANVIKVGKKEMITSLSKAIELAVSGDTILLQEGNYREGNIQVTKPVVIIGINNSVLDGENKYEHDFIEKLTGLMYGKVVEVERVEKVEGVEEVEEVELTS